MCNYTCLASDDATPPSEDIGAQRLAQGPVCGEEMRELLENEKETALLREPVNSTTGSSTGDPIRAILYDYHLCRVLDGNWYSIGSSQRAGTSWRQPRLLKAIDASCQMDVMRRIVEEKASAVAAAAGTRSCFDACPSAPRVATSGVSPCYATCFYQTLLGGIEFLEKGPSGATIDDEMEGGRERGMTSGEIAAAWLAGFDECPEYDEARRHHGRQDADAAAGTEGAPPSDARTSRGGALLP